MIKIFKRLFCQHHWHHYWDDSPKDFGNKKKCLKCGKTEKVYMGWI